jgi:hypothetical protein
METKGRSTDAVNGVKRVKFWCIQRSGKVLYSGERYHKATRLSRQSMLDFRLQNVDESMPEIGRAIIWMMSRQFQLSNMTGGVISSSSN